MKLYLTEIKAICPKSGEIKKYCGPNIKAISPKLAQEFCDNNGLGYCEIIGELVSEIPTLKDGISPDFGGQVDYENTQLN